MTTAAAVAWLVTAFGGLLLASTSVAAGGMRQHQELDEAAVGGRRPVMAAAVQVA